MYFGAGSANFPFFFRTFLLLLSHGRWSVVICFLHSPPQLMQTPFHTQHTANSTQHNSVATHGLRVPDPVLAFQPCLVSPSIESPSPSLFQPRLSPPSSPVGSKRC